MNKKTLKQEKSLKVSVYIATSVDGFIARPDGGLDWLPGSDGVIDPAMMGEDFGFSAFMDSVDVLAMGRNTYELVISSGQWPYGNTRVIVLSNTLKTLADFIPNSAELKSCPPHELYKELQNSGFSHLYIDGGKTIQSFLCANLINEITITKVPVLIGEGIPLFSKLTSDIKLSHLQTISYKNGFVQSKYEII